MTRKNIIAALAVMLACNTISAQSAYDALNFSKVDYEGTARTVAMGNAFTALGGDMGAISINPASTAVMNRNEFTLSLGVNPFSSQSSGFNNSDGTNTLSSYKDTRTHLSNAGGVAVFDTGNYSGLVSINFGFAYNRTRSFNSCSTTANFNNQSTLPGYIAYNSYGLDRSLLSAEDPFCYDVPVNSILAWQTGLINNLGDSDTDYIGATENINGDGDLYTAGLLKQSFFRKTSGGIDEFAFNVGANISDKLYFGINFNLYSLALDLSEEYLEEGVNLSDFATNFNSMTRNYYQSTVGSGVNAKFGIIWRPIANLRLGATFTTPTWYDLTDFWSTTMSSRFSDGFGAQRSTPDYEYSYRVATPLRWSVGGALTIGHRGLVSVDYEEADYSSIRMMDYNRNPREFSGENDVIEKEFRNAGNLRIGAELRVTPGFSLRGGYNYFASAEKSFDSSRRNWSLGFGLRIAEGIHFDFAFQQSLNPRQWESYTLYGEYDGLPGLTYETLPRSSKLIFTLGFKF